MIILFIYFLFYIHKPGNRVLFFFKIKYKKYFIADTIFHD